VAVAGLGHRGHGLDGRRGPRPNPRRIKVESPSPRQGRTFSVSREGWNRVEPKGLKRCNGHTTRLRKPRAGSESFGSHLATARRATTVAAAFLPQVGANRTERTQRSHNVNPGAPQIRRSHPCTKRPLGWVGEGPLHPCHRD
jgi:hypothetical protein